VNYSFKYSVLVKTDHKSKELKHSRHTISIRSVSVFWLSDLSSVIIWLVEQY